MTVSEAISRAIANPEEGRLALDRLDAEDSLMNFVRLTWPILEPGRRLAEGWALDAMCEHLEAVARGDIKKLLINVPPGCMKSLLVNVFLPAWMWGPLNMAEKRFVSWSYAEQLTVRDNRKCRILVESPLYQMLWGDRFQITGDQNEKKFYENDKRGFKLASGILGGGTGHRGDVLVVDDPHKVLEAESEIKREEANFWMTETLPTRTTDDQAAFIVIMQRIHERDVSGILLANDLGYEHLCLPMEFEHDHPHLSKTSLSFVDPRTKLGELLWEDRFPKEQVEDLKKQLRAIGGSYAEAGQLQQRPAPRGGGMFQHADFKFVDEAPKVARSIRGWDLAATAKSTSPFTAGVKMSKDPEGRLFIEDVRRIQGTDFAVEELIKATAKSDGRQVTQDVPQDPGQAGKVQKSALIRMLHGYVVKSSTETGSKEDRARPLSAQCEGGNLYLVRGPWNDAFMAEACLFPNGQFKDQIDAASRAYARIIMKKPRRIGAAPRAVRG